MKISFDLDGTLFAYPNELISFGLFMQGRGHKVGILTGHAMKHIEDNILPSLKQYFTPDFYIGRDFEPENPRWDADEKNQIWKPQMIKEHNIDIHFDDQVEGDIGEHGNAKVIKV